MIVLFALNIARLPFSFIFIIFRKIFPKIEKRLEFERKNLIEDCCQSFKIMSLHADYCFEVSSEGELEQVRPLIDYFLNLNKKIELIYASESVDKKCHQLAHLYPDQLRILRLPVLSFGILPFLYFQNISFWVTSPIIVFCRYDFYPELLSLRAGRKFYLVAASTKNINSLKLKIYSLFDMFVCANNNDLLFFKGEFPKKQSYTFDFRILQIASRVSKRDQIILNHPKLKSYLNYLESIPASKKIIMGSAWASDLMVLSEDMSNDLKNGDLHLLLVPHDLSESSLFDIKSVLSNLFDNVPIYEISKDGRDFDSELQRSRPGIVILNYSGVLCELYSWFETSFVGGGFERSIHSVLEPFLAGNQVVTAGIVGRSTEFDFIQENAASEIHLLKQHHSLYNLFKQISLKKPDNTIREKILNQGMATFNKIVQEF